MENKIIIFDMDGTLVDTRAIIIEALNIMSIKFDYKKLEEKDVTRLRNTRSINFLKTLGVPIWKGPFLLRSVQKILEGKIENLNLYEGISEVLDSLKKKGYMLGVATSNSKKNVNLFFKKFKGRYFDFKKVNIIPFTKDIALRRISRKYNVKCSDIYYIGDETRDIVSAKRAGAKVIAVTWGLNSRKILESMEPDFIAENPADILDFFERH